MASLMPSVELSIAFMLAILAVFLIRFAFDVWRIPNHVYLKNKMIAKLCKKANKGDVEAIRMLNEIMENTPNLVARSFRIEGEEFSITYRPVPRTINEMIAG